MLDGLLSALIILSSFLDKKLEQNFAQAFSKGLYLMGLELTKRGIAS
jgi:hypothetical protein